jgi:hypothetical protein
MGVERKELRSITLILILSMQMPVHYSAGDTVNLLEKTRLSWNVQFLLKSGSAATASE